MTRGGLIANVECGIISREAADVAAYAEAFKTLWLNGERLTPDMLAAYGIKFAKRNRKRTAKDLAFLGVVDHPEQLTVSAVDLRAQAAPNDNERAIETTVATTAWAGLQSFTGEYQFQVEFPRAAGEVIQSIVGASSEDQKVLVDCEDGVPRLMNFHFYEQNSMFRLNIPFDVPFVEWARANHDGIAVVSEGRLPGPPLRLRIVKPGPQMDEVIRRSVALGTWGKTPTRLYGWM